MFFVCIENGELMSFVLGWFGVFRGPVWVDCEMGGHLFVCTEHGSLGC